MTTATQFRPPGPTIIETMTDAELNHAKRALKRALALVKAERKRRSERKKAAQLQGK